MSNTGLWMIRIVIGSLLGAVCAQAIATSNTRVGADYEKIKHDPNRRELQAHVDNGAFTGQSSSTSSYTGKGIDKIASIVPVERERTRGDSLNLAIDDNESIVADTSRGCSNGDDDIESQLEESCQSRGRVILEREQQDEEEESEHCEDGVESNDTIRTEQLRRSERNGRTQKDVPMAANQHDDEVQGEANTNETHHSVKRDSLMQTESASDPWRAYMIVAEADPVISWEVLRQV